MTGSWREAYRLQQRAFPELAYEAIYAVRQGNLAPNFPPSEIARRSMRRVVQSKLLVSILLGLVALGTTAVLGPTAKSLLAPDLAPALYVATVLVGLLVLELALIWWTGLQVLPTFLSSPILPTLETLPVPSATVDRAGFLLFLRLFDLPAATTVVLTPIAVGLALHSVLAGLAILPGAISVVVFALSLALVTGRFFVRHVQGSPGGSSRMALRWAYLVLWAIPAFAMYGYVTIGPRAVAWLSGVVATGPAGIVDGLLAAYPFPLASLPSLAANGALSGTGSGPGPVLVVLAGSLAYGLLTILLAGWLLTAPRSLTTTRAAGAYTDSGSLRLVTRSAPVSILVKDLRIASRTPAFAFLILLPLLDAVAIGGWTLLSGPDPTEALNIASAAAATAALLATFFSPAFFAIELMGYSYTRTLPLSQRSLILGKVLLVAGVYLLSAGTVLVITLARLFDPLPFALFVLAELPAVLAAAFLEIGILVRVARRRGLPITNLYSGSWWATAVAVPGVIVAGAPLALFELGRASSPALGMGLLALVAIVELGGAATFSLLGAGGGTN
ncbi:MAG: hypothetical protein L3J95_05025 [Thermoplasmata archaeon]|nr:hypothetical protein [Thermoplasmata archaeon]MCI4359763.1 hypothetical protein [Thermoplasmata archaeon]